MTGLRGLLRSVFGRDRNSQSIPDGGVVVDDPAADGPGDGFDDGGRGADGAGVAEYGVTEVEGVDRAGTLARAGFEQVFDATSVPTFILDADGNVAEWNESIVSLTGSDRDEAIGHGHVSELFYPDGRRADTLADKVLDAPENADEVHGVERCDSVRNRYRDTSTMVDRHGERKHIEFTATPLYDGDELVGVTEVVIDRTENVEERDATKELVSEIRGTAEAIGEGNLDARAVCHEECEILDEELLAVIDVVNEMAENLQDLSESVHQQAEQIDQTVRAASGAAADIAENVDEQNELLEESVSEMQSFSAGMEEVAATADQVDSAAVAASESADEGLDASEDAREATEDVIEIGDELVESVGALSDRMDDIEEVIEVINDIAEQTNLLALNANIEAARAGEGGDGFGAVADEIKTLAAASQEQLDEIAESVEEVNQGIEEVASATDQQAASTEEVAAMIDQTTENADDIADRTDGISKEL